MECNLKPGADVIVVQQQCPDNMPALAMLSSPWQEWEDVYELPEAIRRGTIFPGLDKPFLEGACSCV